MGLNGYKWKIFHHDSGTQSQIGCFGACENTIRNLLRNKWLGDLKVSVKTYKNSQ
jgi:hypothetical protein